MESESASASPEPAIVPSPAAPGLDVVVRVEAPARGLVRRLRRVQRQTGPDVRLVVISAGLTDAVFWDKLQRLAHEHADVLLLRSEEAGGFATSLELAIAQAAGRDLLLLGPEARVFPKLISRVREVAQADAQAALLSPLSNRARQALDSAWQAPLLPPASLSAKRWAKLIARVSPRQRPELRAPSPECVWIRGQLVAEVGPIGPPAASVDEVLAEYARRARAAGQVTRLVDDAYVHVVENSRTATAREPEQSSSMNGNPTFAELLAWHVRRGTALNRPAPLVLLDGSPFSGARAEESKELELLIDDLSLPRVVLAYPTVAGIEIAEILRGDWHNPLFYKRELYLPLAAFVEDLSEARAAITEIAHLFQIGWVHVHGLEAWPRAIHEVLLEQRLPYCVTVDDDALTYFEEENDEPAPAQSFWGEFLRGARRLLCTTDATSRALGERLGVKDKRRKVLSRHALPEAAASLPPEVVATIASAYAACARRAPRSVRRWRSPEQLRRLIELRRRPGSLIPPRAQPEPSKRETAQAWIKGFSGRVPSLLRLVKERLPYPRR
jgi:GT2 family glycosyltransferase